MDFAEALEHHAMILAEAAIIECLKRAGTVTLHPELENALLVRDPAGREALAALYETYVRIARQAQLPILLATPTWRAGRDRLAEAGVEGDLNRDAADFMKGLRRTAGPFARNIYLAGLLGTRNDAYKPEEGLSLHAARTVHAWQADRLASAGVDVLQAVTLPAVDEATGMALAMEATGLPFLVSFVIGRHGRLLDGTPLGEAIGRIDGLCDRPPLGYMINCAYPSFLHPATEPPGVLERLVGFQANGSSLDHGDLDGAGALEADPVDDWGDRMLALHRDAGFTILGGCCGTGPEHLAYLARGRPGA